MGWGTLKICCSLAAQRAEVQGCHRTLRVADRSHFRRAITTEAAEMRCRNVLFSGWSCPTTPFRLLLFMWILPSLNASVFALLHFRANSVQWAKPPAKAQPASR
jgi:hypothetical protein